MALIRGDFFSRSRASFFSLAILVVLFFSCRTPFDPEIPQTASQILVVEGYLDMQGTLSELKISRMSGLDSSQSPSPETAALIYLESSVGTKYYLEEDSEGRYLFQYNLGFDDTYRLFIELQDGERYQSAPLTPIQTPEIIDVGFLRDEEGVEIFLTTQGNENADDFLWGFVETWAYRPRIGTSYIYDASIGNVRDRFSDEQISICYKSASSPDILLETSSRFQDQVVFRQTITEIPENDERIMDRYSILISQMAIDEEASKFWEILKKNSNDIGSIFSPLPSLIRGNISHIDDPAIPVVGQVSLGVIRQKRLFVDLQDVTPWNFVDPQFNDCIVSAEAVYQVDYQRIFGSGDIVPVVPIMERTTIVAFYPTYRRCADCSLYASPILPDFWEED
ncbi:hypothetical protein B0E43_01790 [Algoriphagus sp. A40]|nr:hypothetical protein B0E43_01790 [Algoriphagus sp. A40]